MLSSFQIILLSLHVIRMAVQLRQLDVFNVDGSRGPFDDKDYFLDFLARHETE